ncbi:MAG TPA: hypothetical protein V6C86_15770 [Oculatellaceae cyanobacterium]
MITLETLRLLENILFRSVLIALLFAIFLAAAAFGGWDSWIGVATKWCHTDEAHISSAMLTLFTEIRFLVVFLLLTPALAIHWTVKRENSKGSATNQKHEKPSLGGGQIATQS